MVLRCSRSGVEGVLGGILFLQEPDLHAGLASVSVSIVGDQLQGHCVQFLVGSVIQGAIFGGLVSGSSNAGKQELAFAQT